MNKVVFEDWCELECVNCHNRFRVLRKDVNHATSCPFCNISPVQFDLTLFAKECDSSD